MGDSRGSGGASSGGGGRLQAGGGGVTSVGGVTGVSLARVRERGIRTTRSITGVTIRTVADDNAPGRRRAEVTVSFGGGRSVVMSQQALNAMAAQRTAGNVAVVNSRTRSGRGQNQTFGFNGPNSQVRQAAAYVNRTLGADGRNVGTLRLGTRSAGRSPGRNG